MEIDGVRAPAVGLTDEDSRKLQRLLGSGRARVVIALCLSPAVDQGAWPRLDLNVYTYDKGPTGTPLAIGVTDKEFQSIFRAAGRPRYDKPEWALRWLNERLVLPPLPGSAASTPGRMVISAGPRESAEEPVAFRIHGRGVAVDVKTVGDRVMLSRVVLRGHDAQQGPLRLINRSVAFTDESQATRLRAEMKRQLAKLASGEGFLAMWNTYNRKESWWIHRRIHDDRYLKYDRVVRRHDGTLRFHVAVPTGPDEGKLSLLDQAYRRNEDEALELEASITLPSVLLREPAADGEEWGLLDDELPQESVSGEVLSADPVAGTVDVRPRPVEARAGMPVQRRDPAPQGFLYRSFRGDRRRLMRRRKAFDLVRKGRTAIPNLLALLEGDPAPAPVLERPIDPKSEATWACFKKGRPTEAQESALRVALNTPDVAIIQGPPGTGKTQVIAALQTRLAEAGRGYARLRGSMLLTSYQHAAVDELVERSVVFGLPANKVDRAGRGTTVQIDRWQTETTTRLTERIAKTDQGPGMVALRRAAALAAGYLLAPTDAVGTAAMFRELMDLTDGLVPGRITDRLRNRLAALRVPRPVLIGSDAEELAVRAVRGIRVSAESFGDDGPAGAAKALRRLRTLTDVDLPDNGLELLERAAAWDEPGPPVFLAELAALRITLLELLATPAGPAPAPAVDPELRRLIEDTVDALADQTAESAADGVTLALLDYREALDGDPDAVHWTLREYTASYAATCQQVSSPAMAEAKGESYVDDLVFDTVIVDEAARANPLDLMIPLIHAGRRIVLVGDHNQLPQMLEPDVEREFEPVTRELLSESLFQRLFEGLAKPGVPVQRVVTLDSQFRMHRVLGDFVNRNFYGDLKSPRPDDEFAHGLSRYGTAVAVWLDVPPSVGPEYGERSKCRPAEAVAVAEEVARLVDETPDLTIGVIAFYSAQVEEICRKLAEKGLLARVGRDYEVAERLRYDSGGHRMDRLLVGTVDAFQGKEFDIVLLSTTRCAPRQEVPPAATDRTYPRWVARRYGHLTLQNRLCVAMSRQKRLLISVGAASMFDAGFAPPALAPLTDFLDMCGKGAPYGHLGR
ncbi:DEAD/DEAH box helicase [Streptomyces griseus]|uniref:DEAD/DEAH box helicase n=1 Tax=Streptomyces TaxID=1883 RepID=UPI0004C7B06A|nr:AAA domain-containing protein [Streptomyces griseus]